jgi:hypothetical protein
MGWLRSRRHRYSDLSVSIEEHLQEAVDELMAEGLSREEAETAARRRFGNVTLTAEHSREVWRWGFLENLWADLRLACRQAVKSPRFTIATVLTLALGIAAQVTIYSVVHAVLIDPYPYRGAMRMVHVSMTKSPTQMTWCLRARSLRNSREPRCSTAPSRVIVSAPRSPGKNYRNKSRSRGSV